MTNDQTTADQASASMPCSAFLEDNAICDDVGEPKGQCTCGWSERDHKPFTTPEVDGLNASIRSTHDGYFVMTDFARKLERDRNQCKAALQEIVDGSHGAFVRAKNLLQNAPHEPRTPAHGGSD